MLLLPLRRVLGTDFCIGLGLLICWMRYYVERRLYRLPRSVSGTELLPRPHTHAWQRAGTGRRNSGLPGFVLGTLSSSNMAVLPNTSAYALLDIGPGVYYGSFGTMTSTSSPHRCSSLASTNTAAIVPCCVAYATLLDSCSFLR